MSASQTPDAAIAKECEAVSKLIGDGKEDEALTAFADILTRTSNFSIRAGIYNGVGQVYCNRGQMAEAEEMFRAAHKLAPQSADAMANIGLLYKWNGNLDVAERWIRRALGINPWHGAAQFTLALIHLLRGDYATGFNLYECRWRYTAGGLKKLETNQREWDGTNGSCVYVYGEQGAGDMMLMTRYARLIRNLGLKQAWVFTDPMVPLMRTIPEIDLAVGAGEKLPEFDCHIPMASLPRLFETEINSVPPPIIPMPDPFDFGPGFHVGICWRGNKTQLNDKIRSTNLDLWKPVLDVPGITFHSMQVDGADEALFYPCVKIHNKPKDWLETARRVAGLDLMISVDTAMVHLAGSIGVPCWCALHCRPYFVFPLVTDQCPWYPSVRLFKQKKEFDWTPVFENIASELCKLHTNKQPCSAPAGG